MGETAGYSGKPLPEKLGIRPGFRIALIDAPRGFRLLLDPLPKAAIVVSGRARSLDLIHVFASSRRKLTDAFPRAKERINPNGMVWVSWPKRSSALQTDLSENVVREIGLANGLVDIKVVAVDADWSGLKFVYRIKDRPKG